MSVLFKIVGTIEGFYRTKFSEKDIPHIYSVSITSLILAFNLYSLFLLFLIINRINSFDYLIEYGISFMVIWISVYLFQKRKKEELKVFVSERRDNLLVLFLILFTIVFFATVSTIYRGL